MLSKSEAEVPLGHLTRGAIGGTEYPAAVLDDLRNVLTVRDSRDAKRTVIPARSGNLRIRLMESSRRAIGIFISTVAFSRDGFTNTCML